MVQWLLDTLLPYVAIALIVLFQPEIRRAMDRFGRSITLSRFSSGSPASSYDDVVLAAGYFSQNRIGALIAFERDVGLRIYVESGIPIDANMSYDFLLAIFQPGSPMHDGAVILQGTRIASAACFLPLSLNPMISNQLGTRHRAAIGVTEESDAVVVVVSEQTGAISLAVSGAIEMGLSVEQLNDRLANLFPQIPVDDGVARGRLRAHGRSGRLSDASATRNACFCITSGLKVLALAISFALWALYTAEPFADVAYNVPLAFVNVPAGLALTGDAPNAVHVRLRGRTGLLRRLTATDLNFTINLASTQVGRRCRCD